ncbi:hypothetical protein BC832DRAFT_590569 [Gaertneriomyces semiglobifer]|nr:hypothetical protein BC832DRAFT_590569 [Gaertneriomyces semiglobifer]
MAEQSSASGEKAVAAKGARRVLVVLGSDHIGLDLKKNIIDYLSRESEQWEGSYTLLDVGVQEATRCDYPDYAKAAADAILANPDGKYESKLGILVCGSGIGISIAANKVRGIRCALVHDHYTAVMARKHNDANMIAVGARTIGPDVALDIVKTFLQTPYDGAHHTERLKKLHDIEGCCYQPV